MSVEIREVGPEALTEYAKIPIRFRVSSLFRVEGSGETRVRFVVDTACC